MVRQGVDGVDNNLFGFPPKAALSSPAVRADLVVERLHLLLVVLGRRGQGGAGAHALSEDLTLTVGLLFRCLAPMRNRENMRTVAEGIEPMQREEAAYWLGMAMHRKRPRRVLAALRILLTEPKRKSERTLEL